MDPIHALIALSGAAAVAAVALAAWVGLRAGRRRGEAEGRMAREAEIAALAAGRSALADELAQCRSWLAARDGQLDAAREQLQRLAGERAGLATRAERAQALEGELAQVRAALQAATAHGAELAARLQEQQQAAGDRLRDLEQSRERMRLEFQSLATQILDDKARRFGEHNSEQIGQLLAPLREQLGEFRKAVGEAYEKEGGARTALQVEVRQLIELNHKLGSEAHSLTRALTADSRSQGYWGELKLERLLELAGLERGREYLTQESYRDADGDLYRPDAVLRLPGDRDIVIDAKVALTDYQRACETADEEQRERHLGQHVAALRRHVMQLGSKDYSRLEGLNAPDLVFLFVPVEGAFLEALRRDPAIYEDAFRRRIIPVGPSNLLASLRLVAQLWRTEEQDRNARLIADRAGKLYDKFVGFIDDLAKVGDALERAQKMHQSALAKLAQGRGNLVRRAEQLRSLGVAPGKQLPDSLLGLSGPGDDEDEGDSPE